MLQGDSIANIQKQYEMLSDILTEQNGKVHGSQRERDPKIGLRSPSILLSSFRTKGRSEKEV